MHAVIRRSKIEAVKSQISIISLYLLVIQCLLLCAKCCHIPTHYMEECYINFLLHFTTALFTSHTWIMHLVLKSSYRLSCFREKAACFANETETMYFST